jgi:hypothetical protein
MKNEMNSKDLTFSWRWDNIEAVVEYLKVIPDRRASASAKRSFTHFCSDCSLQGLKNESRIKSGRAAADRRCARWEIPSDHLSRPVFPRGTRIITESSSINHTLRRREYQVIEDDAALKLD